MRIEEAIQAVDGIKKIRSQASEGFGRVTVEMRTGYDIQKLTNDIKVRVDGISTFPVETERPDRRGTDHQQRGPLGQSLRRRR